MFADAETGRGRGEDPSSERWLQYYREARQRRRALGPRERTRFKLRRLRNRQLAGMAIGVLTLAILCVVFYAVLR